MEGRLVLKNCSLFRADGRIREGMAILVEGGRIAKLAPDSEIPLLPGDWEVACAGRLVAPGLVDCHTHLVGGQLVPTSGEFLLRSPRVRLGIQRAVEASVTRGEYATLVDFAVGRALRSGITLSVEHAHAPKDTLSALTATAATAKRLGMRLSASHASTSLDGASAGFAQLEANLAFVDAFRGDPLVRPALGFHSSWTCDDDLLRRIGRAREELGCGLHFHLAESEEDLTATFTRHGKRVVARLETFGLLCAGAVASYARAIDRAESERMMRTRTLIALSPRLTMLQESGGGGFESVFGHQNLVGLGTCGVSTLWSELQFAFTGILHIARMGRLLDPDGFLAQLLISAPAELCSMLYGAPSGIVEAGALADLVVYDHVPAQESVGGMTPHLLLQLGRSRVAWTIVGGRVSVREGELLGADYLELGREAAKALKAIWARAGAGAA